MDIGNTLVHLPGAGDSLAILLHLAGVNKAFTGFIFGCGKAWAVRSVVYI